MATKQFETLAEIAASRGYEVEGLAELTAEMNSNSFEREGNSDWQRRSARGSELRRMLAARADKVVAEIKAKKGESRAQKVAGSAADRAAREIAARAAEGLLRRAGSLVRAGALAGMSPATVRAMIQRERTVSVEILERVAEAGGLRLELALK